MKSGFNLTMSEVEAYLAQHKKEELTVVKPTRKRPGRKRCRVCERWKASTTRHFYRKKGSADGLDTICKPCDLERSRNLRKQRERAG